MRWLVALLSCGLLVMAGGCHGRLRADQAPGGEAAAVALPRYLPLAVGNLWVYQTSFHEQPQADLEVKIVERQGDAYLDNRPVPSRLVIDAEGIRDGNRRYLLKLPLVKGSKWMSVADVRTVEHYRILEVDRRVRVPAGTFSGCLVVRMEVIIDQQRRIQNDMTFAPDVGIVRITTRMLDGARSIPQSDLQLKKYHLVQQESGSQS